jgi:hypothetical protein
MSFRMVDREWDKKLQRPCAPTPPRCDSFVPSLRSARSNICWAASTEARFRSSHDSTSRILPRASVTSRPCARGHWVLSLPPRPDRYIGRRFLLSERRTEQPHSASRGAFREGRRSRASGSLRGGNFERDEEDRAFFPVVEIGRLITRVGLDERLAEGRPYV